MQIGPRSTPTNSPNETLVPTPLSGPTSEGLQSDFEQQRRLPISNQMDKLEVWAGSVVAKVSHGTGWYAASGHTLHAGLYKQRLSIQNFLVIKFTKQHDLC